ncbi:polysaccharide deacetylase family protein [Listeria booriae]|uniref:polysaccharide deacetylase family protein n=1 Tax=Listeria booriae TaxID=1552123 RepID=UPI00163DA6B4|nr:polysaccharide deacetylase family protein [Listeria booriae]MBC1307910.1 polysaccharide deacetylase family protein [Listeria booriae]
MTINDINVDMRYPPLMPKPDSIKIGNLTGATKIDLSTDLKIEYAVEPKAASQAVLFFSDSSTVDVSESGVITAKAAGKATIKIQSAARPSVFVEVTIEVVIPSIIPIATMVDTFTSTAEWLLQTAAATSSRVVDVVNTHNTQSMKLTGLDGNFATMRHKTAHVDLRDETAAKLSFFVHDLTTISKIAFYFANDTAVTKTAMKVFQVTDLKQGWNNIAFSLASMTLAGGFSFNNEILAMQVRIDPVASVSASVSFDALESIIATRGNAVFTMDDNWIDQYTKAYPILKAQGLRGNIAVIKNKVDATGYMTKANLSEVYESRWDMLNHTSTHPELSTITKAEQKIELDGCRDYLNTNGFNRASDCVVYPRGSYNADLIATQIEGNYRWGRSLINGIDIDDPASNYLVKTINLVPVITLAQAKAAVDEAYRAGGTVVFLIHKLVPESEIGSDTMFYSIERYEALAAYVAEKVSEKKINNITVSEWLQKEKAPRSADAGLAIV